MPVFGKWVHTRSARVCVSVCACVHGRTAESATHPAAPLPTIASPYLPYLTLLFHYHVCVQVCVHIPGSAWRQPHGHAAVYATPHPLRRCPRSRRPPAAAPPPRFQCPQRSIAAPLAAAQTPSSLGLYIIVERNGSLALICQNAIKNKNTPIEAAQ